MVALSGDNHVVVTAESHAGFRPGVKVVPGRHVAAGVLGLAHGPELVEGGGSSNRRLVDPLVCVEVVSAAVAGHCALLCRALRRVVVAKVLEDVVLHERVLGPAVDGEVGVTVCAPCSADADRLWSTWIPALANNKVALPTPRDAVGTTSKVVVVELTTIVGPHGVEKSVVGAGALRCSSFEFQASRFQEYLSWHLGSIYRRSNDAYCPGEGNGE